MLSHALCTTCATSSLSDNLRTKGSKREQMSVYLNHQALTSALAEWAA